MTKLNLNYFSELFYSVRAMIQETDFSKCTEKGKHYLIPFFEYESEFELEHLRFAAAISLFLNKHKIIEADCNKVIPNGLKWSFDFDEKGIFLDVWHD